MKRTAVIMAGGRGERFWPQSRTALPKQFLSLTDDGKTLLQLTVERLLPVVELQDIFVVTSEQYASIVKEQVPELPRANILCEPMAKNTAPALGFAAAAIAARYTDATMYVMPSDHVIKNKRLFADTLRLAGKVAEQQNALITLGITPTYPETGYGYIRFDQSESEDLPNVYRVDRFVEKPDYVTAERYVEDGNYLWNSGMFVWKASTFLNALKEFLPSVAELADTIKTSIGTETYHEKLEDAFQKVVGVSVDYGVMEKARNVYTIPSSFVWNDVGSWRSIEGINQLDSDGNVAKGNVVHLESENSVFVSNSRLITAAGVKNLIVVETPDVVLVCDKDSAQDVKKIVEKLKSKNMNEYL